jgi:hypothetical protein
LRISIVWLESFFAKPNQNDKTKLREMLFKLAPGKPFWKNNEYQIFVPLIAEDVPDVVFTKVIFGVLGDELSDGKERIGMRKNVIQERKCIPFDPIAGSSFITHFKRELKYSCADYIGKKHEDDEGKKRITIQSLYDPISEDADTILLDTLSDEKAQSVEETVIGNNDLVDLASIMKLYEEQLTPRTKIQQRYFTSIFTYDTVSRVKNYDEYASTVSQEPLNSDLIVYMVHTVLVFLLKKKDTYREMLDVVEAHVEEYIDWSRRQEMLEKCYNKTGLNMHFDSYDRICVKMLGNLGAFDKALSVKVSSKDRKRGGVQKRETSNL